MQADTHATIPQQNTLTSVAKTFSVFPVILADIEDALGQQIKDDEAGLKAISKEQKKLLPYLNRARDLANEEKRRNLRLRRVKAALGTDRFETVSKSMRAGNDVSTMVGTVTADDLPLWEVIWAIVDQKPGIQVIELQLVLEQLGRAATRQAIESSLKTHADQFETKTRGREKFVSLKGA